MLALQLLTDNTYINAQYKQIHLQIYILPTSHLSHQNNNICAVMQAHPLSKRIYAAYAYIARMHHTPVRGVQSTIVNHLPIISTAHILWRGMPYYQISVVQSTAVSSTTPTICRSQANEWWPHSNKLWQEFICNMDLAWCCCELLREGSKSGPTSETIPSCHTSPTYSS
jgi:hypothetical protein